ncbi:MAG: hypothetical protein ACNA8W_15985, partial [Bradymonadaceae bacterium]
AVRVTGRVTLNGEALPAATDSRGRIVLRNLASGGTYSHQLQTSGRASFVATVPPGEYEVSFMGNAELCTQPDSWPCTGGILLPSVMLTEDGELPVDIKGVHVLVDVTVDGAPYGSDANWAGRISFRRSDGSMGYTAQLHEETNPGSVLIHLLAGTYEVSWRPDATMCRTEEQPAVPCNHGVLVREVEFIGGQGQGQGFGVDVPTTRVGGRVTANSVELPEVGGLRGRLNFVGDDESDYRIEAQTTGPVSYEATLIAGTYDIHWIVEPLVCDGVPPQGLPCSSGVVMRDVDLVGDETLDVDLPTVDIHGEVTINGATMADHAESRGSLYFRGDGGRTNGLRMGEDGRTGPATYAITLLAGEYTAWWGPGAQHCQSPGTVAPCMEAPISDPLNLTSSGTRDLPVSMVSVTGTLSLDGRPLPETAIDPGRLSLVRVDDGGRRYSFHLDAGGQGAYTITALLPGVYDVHWHPASALCDSTKFSALPCNSGPIARGLEVQGSGDLVMDRDMSRIVISGDVKFGGESMPTTTEDRGDLVFELADGESTTIVALGQDNSTAFEVSLLPGDYRIIHRANAAMCNVASPTIPCVSSVLTVCED